jgi:branched-subunit amino acid permease
MKIVSKRKVREITYGKSIVVNARHSITFTAQYFQQINKIIVPANTKPYPLFLYLARSLSLPSRTVENLRYWN